MTTDEERARRIWRESLVVDMHNDLPSRMLDDGYDPDVRHPPGTRPGEGHTDVPRLLESGVGGQWMAAWVHARHAAVAGESFARAMALVDAIHALVGRHPRRLALAERAADVRRIHGEGKVAVLVAIEGGHAIEGSLERLAALRARGARYMTLTWNNGNAWAGSSLGEGGTSTGGLTRFGREVVREMERLGVLVDVSHVSDATFDDVVDVATRPIVASHSNARALHDHPRNLTDDQLRAIAESGGVACVNFHPLFLDPAFAAGRRSRTPLSLLVDHLAHMADIAGIDHVGLGSDFDGIDAVPDRLDDVTATWRVAAAMLERGFEESDVRKVIGENVMRVME